MRPYRTRGVCAVYRPISIVSQPSLPRVPPANRMLPGRSPGDRSRETQRIIDDCSVLYISDLRSIHIDVSIQRTTQQGGSEAQRSASLRGSTHTHTHTSVPPLHSEVVRNEEEWRSRLYRYYRGYQNKVESRLLISFLHGYQGY